MDFLFSITTGITILGASAFTEVIPIILGVQSSSNIWREILPHDQCFLRIFDISFTEGVDPKLLVRENKVDSVKPVLESLPNQDQQTFRVYFEENLATNVDFLSHLGQAVSPAIAQEYDRMAIKTGLATMRSQWRRFSNAPWWESESYQLDWLGQRSRNPTYRDSLSLSASILRRVMRFRIAEDADDNILVIISCKSMKLRLEALFEPSVLQRQTILRPSAEVVEIILEEFCQHILELDEVYKSIGKDATPPAVLKQLLLLRYCHASVDEYSDFLHVVQTAYAGGRERLSDPRRSVLTNRSLAEITADAYFYEELNDRVTDLAGAVDALVEILGASFSERQQFVEFRSLAAELQATCSDLKKTASRLSMRLDNHLRFFELSRSMNESLNVRLLSLLASIFLPLSLASGLLSMQTRLANLHYLLYDFCGVIVLLGTIIVAVFLILRIFVWWRERLVKWDEIDFFRRHVRPFIRHSVAACLIIGWALLTASFLVGMIKDVGLGLRILGYGTVVIAGLILIPSSGVVLLWFLFK